MKSAVFDALPGLEVPVGGIAQNLARLWEGSPGDGAAGRPAIRSPGP